MNRLRPALSLRHCVRGVGCLALTSLAFLSGGVRADELTLARMFAAPDLSGPTLRGLQFSPDGRRVGWLQGSADDKDRLELWAYDVASGQRRRLLDTRALLPAGEHLSPEEAARRERQRTSSLHGILEYQFAADSHRVLVPLAGDLYVYDLEAPPGAAAQRIPDTEGEATDPRFSPRGHFLSFVRGGNLYVYDFTAHRSRRLTPHDCTGLVSCGGPEFIAQEEMDRFTGYWWSPDESRIAWTRVDATPVPAIERFEIGADDVRVVTERYPAAGKANANVRLFTTTLADGSTVEIPFAAAAATLPKATVPRPEYYLARVDWFPDSRTLAVQRQTRDQKTLDLLRADSDTGVLRVLLSEHSDTWVTLNDELTFLRDGPRFLWASDRSGYRQLYLYDDEGRLLHAVTSGPWMVVGDRRGRAIRGIDSKQGLVYFEANRDSPLERHLYVASYRHPGGPIRRVSLEPGWHGVQIARNAQMYLDRYSSVDQPPTVTLRAITGATLATLSANKLDASHPYAPYLDSRPTHRFGSITAEDGQALYYELIEPPHLDPAQRHPVVIEVYGGPGVQFVANQWGDQSAFFEQLLTEHGYVVFKLDNRGSGERGARFESVLYHSLGQMEVRDQVRGVEFLKTLSFVDPKRIGLFGWSYGGYLTLRCLLEAPGVFAAGIAGAPVTDWSRYDTHYTERYLGTPQNDPGAYTEAGVLEIAQNLQTPLLLLHGMADDNVLFTNSTALMKRLQDLGKPFELMTYPGAKHSLLRHADTGPHAYETILRFLDAQLAPATPEPSGTDKP